MHLRLQRALCAFYQVVQTQDKKYFITFVCVMKVSCIKKMHQNIVQFLLTINSFNFEPFQEGFSRRFKLLFFSFFLTCDGEKSNLAILKYIKGKKKKTKTYSKYILNGKRIYLGFEFNLQ